MSAFTKPGKVAGVMVPRARGAFTIRKMADGGSLTDDGYVDGPSTIAVGDSTGTATNKAQTDASSASGNSYTNGFDSLAAGSIAAGTNLLGTTYNTVPSSLQGAADSLSTLNGTNLTQQQQQYSQGATAAGAATDAYTNAQDQLAGKVQASTVNTSANQNALGAFSAPAGTVSAATGALDAFQPGSQTVDTQGSQANLLNTPSTAATQVNASGDVAALNGFQGASTNVTADTSKLGAFSAAAPTVDTTGTTAALSGFSPTASEVDVSKDVAPLQNASVTAQQTSTGSFDQAAADKYMSPYLSSVVASTMNAYDYNAARQQALTDAALGASHMFGSAGAIASVTNAQQNALNRASTLSNLENTGYTQAQTQYDTDQSRALTSQQSNQSSDLAAQQSNLTAKEQAASLDAAAQTSNQSAGLTASGQRLSGLQSAASTDLAGQQANQQAALTASSQDLSAAQSNAANEQAAQTTNAANALAKSGQELSAKQSAASTDLAAQQANQSANVTSAGQALSAKQSAASTDLASQTANQSAALTASGQALSADQQSAADKLAAAQSTATNSQTASAQDLQAQTAAGQLNLSTQQSNQTAGLTAQADTTARAAAAAGASTAQGNLGVAANTAAAGINNAAYTTEGTNLTQQGTVSAQAASANAANATLAQNAVATGSGILKYGTTETDAKSSNASAQTTQQQASSTKDTSTEQDPAPSSPGTVSTGGGTTPATGGAGTGSGSTSVGKNADGTPTGLTKGTDGTVKDANGNTYTQGSDGSYTGSNGTKYVPNGTGGFTQTTGTSGTTSGTTGSPGTVVGTSGPSGFTQGSNGTVVGPDGQTYTNNGNGVLTSPDGKTVYTPNSTGGYTKTTVGPDGAISVTTVPKGSLGSGATGATGDTGEAAGDPGLHKDEGSTGATGATGTVPGATGATGTVPGATGATGTVDTPDPVTGVSKSNPVGNNPYNSTSTFTQFTSAAPALSVPAATISTIASNDGSPGNAAAAITQAFSGGGTVSPGAYGANYSSGGLTVLPNKDGSYNVQLSFNGELWTLPVSANGTLTGSATYTYGNSTGALGNQAAAAQLAQLALTQYGNAVRAGSSTVSASLATAGGVGHAADGGQQFNDGYATHLMRRQAESARMLHPLPHMAAGGLAGAEAGLAAMGPQGATGPAGAFSAAAPVTLDTGMAQTDASTSNLGPAPQDDLSNPVAPIPATMDPATGAPRPLDTGATALASTLATNPGPDGTASVQDVMGHALGGIDQGIQTQRGLVAKGAPSWQEPSGALTKGMQDYMSGQNTPDSQNYYAHLLAASSNPKVAKYGIAALGMQKDAIAASQRGYDSGLNQYREGLSGAHQLLGDSGAGVQSAFRTQFGGLDPYQYVENQNARARIGLDQRAQDLKDNSGEAPLLADPTVTVGANAKAVEAARGAIAANAPSNSLNQHVLDMFRPGDSSWSLPNSSEDPGYTAAAMAAMDPTGRLAERNNGLAQLAKEGTFAAYKTSGLSKLTNLDANLFGQMQSAFSKQDGTEAYRVGVARGRLADLQTANMADYDAQTAALAQKLGRPPTAREMQPFANAWEDSIMRQYAAGSGNYVTDTGSLSSARNAVYARDPSGGAQKALGALFNQAWDPAASQVDQARARLNLDKVLGTGASQVWRQEMLASQPYQKGYMVTQIPKAGAQSLPSPQAANPGAAPPGP